MNKDLTHYPLVLGVSDIKEILQIGKRQAYELVNSGVFNVLRIGRSIRVPKESFAIWLNGKSSELKVG